MVFFPYLEISLTAWSANWVFVKWNLKRQKRFCIVSTAACSVVRACCTASVQCDKQTVTSFACRQQAVAPVAKVVKLASCDHANGSGPAFFEQEELSTVCWLAWMTCGLGTKADQGCGWCRLAAVLLPLHPRMIWVLHLTRALVHATRPLLFFLHHMSCGKQLMTSVELLTLNVGP